MLLKKYGKFNMTTKLLNLGRSFFILFSYFSNLLEENDQFKLYFEKLSLEKLIS